MFCRKIIFIVSVLALSSCFKEELPVGKVERGPVTFASFDMGIDYGISAYYSMTEKAFTGNISKYDWDLSFSADSTNPYIRLNSGLGILAWKTPYTEFNQFTDTTGLMSEFLYDHPGGKQDSLALRDILQSERVYILHLGRDKQLKNRGYILIKSSLVQNSSYKVEVCLLDKSGENSFNVPFRSGYLEIPINLKEAGILEEPISERWDFQFVQYQHVYHDPFQLYSVVGCMINPERFKACMYEGNKSFKEVNANDLNSAILSNSRDVIGFSWKYYNLSLNQYIIRPEKTYFLQEDNGKLYKIHFTGFYNSQGEKGCPNFEFREL